MCIDPQVIDHTLLRADATIAEIDRLTDEARAHHFATVCVNPAWVAHSAQRLAGSGVKVCTVAGFPLGASTSTTKAEEAREAVENGADEVDMVINLGALKSGDLDLVTADIAAVRQAVPQPRILKAILETCLLSDEQIVNACRAAQAAGADFVKTSTGFSAGGATVEAVRLMRETVGQQMGVKASGGIRSREVAQDMLNAGASRIGASSSIQLIGKE